MQYLRPDEIEKQSFAIIDKELKERGITLADPLTAPIIRRVIHTTAEFSYAEDLLFSEGAVELARKAIREGAELITDTGMALAGINKGRLSRYGCEIRCYMQDEAVAKEAKERGTTRAVVSMEHAASHGGKQIFVIGNAPTALMALYDMIIAGRLSPELIIAVPVGFVNVVEAKEQILTLDTPHIVARGRRGGSNVAAAICNALLYGIEE